MTPDARHDELTRLCQSCGLCCDGSLFGRVPLDPVEVEDMRRRRLRVLDGDKGFEQPCSALSEVTASGTARVCAIYDTRPRACREFACRLFEKHRLEGGPLEARLAAVRRARELLAKLEACKFTAGEYAELEARMNDDFARVR